MKITKKAKKIAKLNFRTSVRLVFFALPFTVLGTWTLISAQASPPNVHFQAEAGNFSGSVSAVSDSTASGGKHILFGSSLTWQPAYPGQPRPGTVLWGSSLEGNTDPYQKHEQPTGVRLGVRRTFQPSWSQSRINTMVSIAQQDLQAGRLPWVSIKPPSWAEMAAGQHDTLIDDMLKKLDALEGPVWLTVHHEPEGGGGNNAPDDAAGPAGHLAMNKRIRQRMQALGTDNIALALILMSYSWSPSSIPPPPQFNHRTPDLWWEDGVYDFLGIDHYHIVNGSFITSRLHDVLTWAHGKGVDVAIGEYGVIDNIPQSIREIHQFALDSANLQGKARIVGMSYFDTTKDGDYVLTGDRLVAFHDMLKHPLSVRWGDIN